MRGIFTNNRLNLILMLAIFAFFLTSCGTHPNSATVTNHTGSAIKNKESSVEEVAAESETEAKAGELYIVENLNMTDETISLYSINDSMQLRYSYNMTTKFMDKYGNSSVWASFTSGTVVTIGDFLPSSGALSSVQKSGDVWIYEDISKYKLEPDNNLITIDGTNYKITDDTRVFSDSDKIPLSSIGESDVITVVGQEKNVISIAVTTGHGYLHLTNTSLFDDSMIFVGNKIVSTVYSDEIIEVPEGTYQVTVANNGWGGSGEYSVTRNQITDINLEDLKGEGPSYCLVTFLVTVPDTYVYIDGEEIDVTEPQYVQYGSHKLVVRCDGYDSWNKTLVVNSESATITLTMESESGTTSADEDNLLDQDGEEVTEEGVEESLDDTTDVVEEETAGSSIKDDYDYEVDYLSTVSDLISNLMN